MCAGFLDAGMIVPRVGLGRKGQLQQTKGEFKGKFDSAVDQTQDSLEDLKKTVNRT